MHRGCSRQTEFEKGLGLVNSRWLLISTVWPEPQSSAAGLRDLNLIEGLGQAGFEVILASAADNPKGYEFCCALESQKPYLKCLGIRLNHSSFDEELKKIAPHAVIYDRLVMEEQYGPRVRAVCPDALQILDTQDLHFLRLSREQGSRSGASALPGTWDESLVIRELSSIHRVDLTWVLSSFEKKLLESHFGVQPQRLALSRFAYPKQRPASFERGFEERRGFSFVGNYRHAPNLDAFRYLRDELWAQIRARLPRAEIELWGAYPTQEVFEAHDPRRGFLVRGVADTMDQVLGSARVSLAPVRFGAGIKGKISDSWHFGVPVVSTPLGFEGMVQDGSLPGGERLSAEGLAEYAVRLDQDPAAWSEARDWGLRQLAQSFSQRKFESELSGGIEQARENFYKRDQDWIRRCFTHHSLETPRFFGKWLELKESKR